MELFSPEFFSALLAIIIIDLVLAGDNAIVIALAARSLPPDLRKRAIIWGTFGAIAVRTAMTLIVVWLLKVPGLMLLGGVLLVWIAYKLLADNDDGGHEVSAAGNFWGAMKTIIIADAVMGLDNVLAVAGAAHGSFLLVVIGLLISIPIVIWGSQIILKYVERYPGIIYIGGAVLAWTAVKMITNESLVKDFFAAYPGLAGLLYIVIIGGVLAGGFWANHAPARRRVAGHVVEPGVPVQVAAGVTRVLLPVDASANSLQAVEHVIARHAAGAALEVHLLHVRVPFSRYIARFVSRSDHQAYHQQEAERALAPARDLLNRAGIRHTDHVEYGDKAETIRAVAERLGISQIVIGTARKNSLTRVLEDSVTHRLLEIVEVPMEVVVGRAVSRVEKIGLPAGLSAAAAVLIAVSLQ